MKKNHSAFSLVEVVVVIAILGVLVGVAVPAVGHILRASKESVASNLVETLNNATKEFGHAQYKIASAGQTATAADELLILQTLQWKDPTITIGVAGPFMRPDWVPDTSDDTEDYRIVWTGSYWKLITPGNDGAGLKVDFEARDVGTNFDFPDGWLPAQPDGSNLN